MHLYDLMQREEREKEKRKWEGEDIGGSEGN
jgi:hypothetical protein